MARRPAFGVPGIANAMNENLLANSSWRRLLNVRATISGGSRESPQPNAPRTSESWQCFSATCKTLRTFCRNNSGSKLRSRPTSCAAAVTTPSKGPHATDLPATMGGYCESAPCGTSAHEANTHHSMARPPPACGPARHATRALARLARHLRAARHATPNACRPAWHAICVQPGRHATCVRPGMARSLRSSWPGGVQRGTAWPCARHGTVSARAHAHAHVQTYAHAHAHATARAPAHAPT